MTWEEEVGEERMMTRRRVEWRVTKDWRLGWMELEVGSWEEGWRR